MNFGPQMVKIGRRFYPPSVNSAFTSSPGFAEEGHQTKLNQALPNGGQQIALTICRRKVGVIPPQKIGAKNFYICSVIRGFRDLIANRQPGKDIGKYEGPYVY